MSKIIAKRYSKALFDLALEHSLLEDIYNDCRGIADFLKQEKSVVRFLTTPNITKEKKNELITESFQGSINEHTLNFMKLLVAKGRAEQLKECCLLYIKNFEDYKGLVKVKVQSAQKLNKGQLDNTKERISSITGKEVMLSTEVKEELIGGMIIKIGNKIIDGSVKSRLKLLEQSLVNAQIK
ncbi:ATP synthase F1 subunit delta [Proteinivorax tanatarense]|uniref:ATP synthase subunit delta n=1 Tax=Proteinivorax tanatarense TaxID=1260629 RepID=A0AAU7VLG3_9FIRM